MYRDEDSNRLFDRAHARDQVLRLARKLRDPGSGYQTGFFSAHANYASREGLISNTLTALIGLAVLMGSLALLLR